MAEITLESIFYGMVLPNSAAGAVFILLILAFRLLTRRWSKGYVRILWILLLACLLAPPLYHGSFYTVRNLGMDRQTDVTDTVRSRMDEQTAGNLNKAPLLMENQSPQEKSFVPSEKEGKDAGISSADSMRAGQLDGSGYLRDQIKIWSVRLWFMGACLLALYYLYQYVCLRKKISDAIYFAGGCSNLAENQSTLWKKMSGEVYSTGECKNSTENQGRFRKKMSGNVYSAGRCNHLTEDQGKLHKKILGAATASVQGYWVSARTDVPFVMPGLVPRIYMPQGIDAEQMADILAHERQHVKNFDPLFKCLAFAALAVYWFHPLVWLAVSLMGKDMEMYCDECVLHGKSIEERKAYSGTLLEYAAKSSGLTFTMHFGESNTGNRIRHIMRVKKPRRIVSLLLAGFIGISGVLFLSSRNVDAQKHTGQAGTTLGGAGSADKYKGSMNIENINKDSANKNSIDKYNTDKGGTTGGAVDGINAENADADNNRNADYKKNAGGENTDHADREDFRTDPYKFAEKIIQFVESGMKEELAQLIYFPIRVELDGDDCYVQNKMEFVENYGKIANEQWKSSVLAADVDDMISNYMGYGMGGGEVWFSEITGQDGYWIYAINNAAGQNGYDRSADAEDYEKSLQNDWQKLAAEHGMTEQEAQKWYVRFHKDDLEAFQHGMRITGCAYEDFDGNGKKDLFFVTSIMPNEIYPESVVSTMYVYGYLNGNLVYQSGSAGFSKDGFVQCESQPVSEAGIGCRILYTVDTDSLEEQPHLIDFDIEGNFVKEQLPGESEKFIRMLAQIPHDVYDNAADVEELVKQLRNSDGENAPDDQVASLYENAADDLYLYSYFTKNYSNRGTIIRYKGVYSYFDLDICGEYGFAGPPSIYFEDIDGDSEAELVSIYSAGHGTGVCAGGLTVFELHRDHTASAYELEEPDQLKQLKQLIHFDRERGRIQIKKGGETKKEIDLTTSPEYEENKDMVEVNYSNWYYYEMEDGQVKLKVGIFGAIGFLRYMDGVEDSLTEFDVLFKDGKFYIDYI